MKIGVNQHLEFPLNNGKYNSFLWEQHWQLISTLSIHFEIKETIFILTIFEILNLGGKVLLLSSFLGYK